MKRLKIVKDEVVYDGAFIKTIRRNFIDLKGGKRVWEMIERKTHGRIVAIVAITPKNEVILEKTFRMPWKSYIIELPAGLMDRRGESEISLAQRELLEETGYSTKHLRKLFSGPYNAGLSTDEMAVYLGTDARYVQKPNRESAEDITVIKVPLKKLFRFLNTTKIGKVDLKISAIIPYLQKLGLLV
ncbi:NUDIX hydrolase [Candidatus Jorgensenbacteria bacterium]|nr:NUDIX hydrolase [Candidatus Jorgensenbacteria bacterium]